MPSNLHKRLWLGPLSQRETTFENTFIDNVLLVISNLGGKVPK